MTSFHATNVPPFGWTSHRRNHCLSSVLPRVDKGQHLKRNCVSASLTNSQSFPSKSVRRVHNIDSARDILFQQRVSIKIFTGNRWPFNRSVKDITERLSKYDSASHPAESKQFFPPLQQTTEKPSATKYSPQDVQDIVDRLSTYDPEKIPESKGYQIKLATPIIYKKKYSKLEIEDIVDRLMDYDPEKFPAESKGTPPVVLHETPRYTLIRPKKCTAREVQELVNRLCEKDPGKWPENKRYRIENAFSTVLSGRAETSQPIVCQ